LPSSDSRLLKKSLALLEPQSERFHGAFLRHAFCCAIRKLRPMFSASLSAKAANGLFEALNPVRVVIRPSPEIADPLARRTGPRPTRKFGVTGHH